MNLTFLNDMVHHRILYELFLRREKQMYIEQWKCVQPIAYRHISVNEEIELLTFLQDD